MVSAQTLKRIHRHVAMLSSTDINVAARAEHALARYYGSRALEQLKAASQDNDPNVRFRAARVLAETHDAQTYETILRLTRDDDSIVRYEAAIALGTLGDERAIEPLIALMSTPDPKAAVDNAAAMGLTQLGKRAVPALIAVLGDVKPAVQQVAARVLGSIGDIAAVTPLSELLKSREEETRIAGIEALAQIPTSRSLELISGCLEDAALEVRENATYWVRELTRRSTTTTTVSRALPKVRAAM